MKIYVHTYIHIYVYTYTHIYIYKYIHKYIDTYVHIYIDKTLLCLTYTYLLGKRGAYVAVQPVVLKVRCGIWSPLSDLRLAGGAIGGASASPLSGVRTWTGPEPDQNQTGTGPEPDWNRIGSGTDVDRDWIESGSQQDRNQIGSGSEADRNRNRTGSEPDRNRIRRGSIMPGVAPVSISLKQYRGPFAGQPFPIRFRSGSDPLPTRFRSGSDPLPVCSDPGPIWFQRGCDPVLRLIQPAYSTPLFERKAVHLIRHHMTFFNFNTRWRRPARSMARTSALTNVPFQNAPADTLAPEKVNMDSKKYETSVASTGFDTTTLPQKSQPLLRPPSRHQPKHHLCPHEKCLRGYPAQKIAF